MVILITGITGGIGSELAKYLVGKGHKVYGCATNNFKIQKLKSRINSNKLILNTIDITKSNKVQKLFENIDKLDVLINCAGIMRPVSKFLNNDLSEWKKTIEVNLFGVAYCCYYALPLLLRSIKGKIINFAGGGSAYGRAYHTAYATSKTAVVRFTESLALEYPKIDINAIAPGAHRTNMWQDEKFEKQPNEWGDMSRLKEFIVYLISDKSNGVTGKFIHYKDNWESFDAKLLSKDLYTLRRME